MWHFIGTRAPARFDVLSGVSEVRLSSGFTSSPIHLTPFRSMSVELAWTIWPSPVRDRQANSALRHIVITRMVYDPRTTEYIDRRTKEGLTKKEAMRCLKRYVAREVFSVLPHDKLGLDSP